MKRNRLRGLIWSVSLLIIAAIAVGTWYILFRTPSIERLFPLNESSSTISILSPEDRSAYPADSSIPILVSSISTETLSEIELWVDGELVTASQPGEEEGMHYSHLFHWTPVKEGNLRVLARAISAEGQVTTSNPLLLQITPPAGARLVAPGQNGYPVTEMNISLSGDSSPLPIRSDLPGTPLDNLPPAELIEGFPEVWLRRQINLNALPPQPPTLTYYINECETTLVVTDNSENELGFFIYRSNPGISSFERIAELKSQSEGGGFTFFDQDSAPGSIYYAVSFNAGGEAPSPPVMIGDYDPSCLVPAAEQGPDGPDQEDLQFLDLAYFYYSFNNGGYQRYPANPEGFLTPSEYPTSLRAMMEGLAGTSSSLVREADVVLWGWSGGILVNLGSYHLEIDDSRLQVCNLGTGCTGDVASGFRSTYGELANDAEEQIREFYWSTSAPGTSGVLWQISTSPFSEGYSPHPYGLVAAGCSEGNQLGTFLVDFKDLDAYLPAPSSCGSLSQPWIEFNRFGWESALLPGL
ncbi:MAG: hypothetical protein ACK2TZ_00010, partial [Anaerolineales bacterium]